MSTYQEWWREGVKLYSSSGEWGGASGAHSLGLVSDGLLLLFFSAKFSFSLAYIKILLVFQAWPGLHGFVCWVWSYRWPDPSLHWGSTGRDRVTGWQTPLPRLGLLTWAQHTGALLWVQGLLTKSSPCSKFLNAAASHVLMMIGKTATEKARGVSASGTVLSFTGLKRRYL